MLTVDLVVGAKCPEEYVDCRLSGRCQVSGGIC
jgi:hypothetical protein